MRWERWIFQRSAFLIHHHEASPQPPSQRRPEPHAKRIGLLHSWNSCADLGGPRTEGSLAVRPCTSRAARELVFSSLHATSAIAEKEFAFLPFRCCSFFALVRLEGKSAKNKRERSLFIYFVSHSGGFPVSPPSTRVPQPSPRGSVREASSLSQRPLGSGTASVRPSGPPLLISSLPLSRLSVWFLTPGRPSSPLAFLCFSSVYVFGSSVGGVCLSRRGGCRSRWTRSNFHEPLETKAGVDTAVWASFGT